MDDAALLTSGEVAAILGVSAERVRQLANSGRLACLRTRGKHRRFRAEEIVRCAGPVAAHVGEAAVATLDPIKGRRYSGISVEGMLALREAKAKAPDLFHLAAALGKFVGPDGTFRGTGRRAVASVIHEVHRQRIIQRLGITSGYWWKLTESWIDAGMAHRCNPREELCLFLQPERQCPRCGQFVEPKRDRLSRPPRQIVAVRCTDGGTHQGDGKGDAVVREEVSESPPPEVQKKDSRNARAADGAHRGPWCSVCGSPIDADGFCPKGHGEMESVGQLHLETTPGDVAANDPILGVA